MGVSQTKKTVFALVSGKSLLRAAQLVTHPFVVLRYPNSLLLRRERLPIPLSLEINRVRMRFPRAVAAAARWHSSCLTQYASPSRTGFFRDMEDTDFQERGRRMKALYGSLIVAGLLVVAGCNVSTTGGKPGESNASFKLKGPANTPETSIKRGEPVTKDITIDPEKNFKEDIAFEVKVEPADGGVSATVEPTSWKADKPKKVELHIKAADDAKEGEYTIHVTGKPAKGNATTVDVKVKVPERK